MLTSDTFTKVKSLIASAFLIPVESQRLIVKGKAVADESKTVDDFGLSDGNMVTLMLAPNFVWDSSYEALASVQVNKETGKNC